MLAFKSMKAIKDSVADMIRDLPEDTLVEDIQYHLYVLDKIQRGRDSIRDGKGLSNKQAKSRLAKWITN